VRLPDLLVSEGVVRAETVVEIFEAQALYGGSFDTNLLELGLLTEARLMPYVERAYSMSNRIDVTGDPVHDALQRLPKKTAVELRVVPFRVVGRTLDVVCADPSDLRALDEVGFATNCRLAVNVAIEARVAQHLARGYGVAMPARLAAVLEGKTWTKPLLRRSRRADVGALGSVGGPDTAPLPRESSIETRPVRRVPLVARPAEAAGDSVTERVLRAEPEALAPPLAERDRPRSERELVARLAAASERDQIPAIVLGFLGDVPRAVLLRARRNELAGWDARGDVARQRIRDLAVPLDRPSVFAAVMADVTPYEGPLPRDAVEAGFLDQLGAASWPTEVLLFPIRVKGRVVSLLYADATQRGALAERRDAIAAAARCTAEALVRIILAKKTT
jgi:hypothetical protein